MGDMADMFLDSCMQHEAEWDDYFNGHMSDEAAMDAGILDSTGTVTNSAQFERVINRNPIPTVDNLNQELKLATAQLGSTRSVSVSRDIRQTLNQAAIDNLSKPHPTCNWCGEQMDVRNGKFGKFYFCTCPEQKTVSDKYWQSVRRK